MDFEYFFQDLPDLGSSDARRPTPCSSAAASRQPGAPPSSTSTARPSAAQRIGPRPGALAAMGAKGQVRLRWIESASPSACYCSPPTPRKGGLRTASTAVARQGPPPPSDRSVLGLSWRCRHLRHPLQPPAASSRVEACCRRRQSLQAATTCSCAAADPVLPRLPAATPAPTLKPSPLVPLACACAGASSEHQSVASARRLRAVVARAPRTSEPCPCRRERVLTTVLL